MKSEDFLRIHDIALADTLRPDFQYYYRSICRWYSKHFNTPLHVVHGLGPAFVLQNYYEATMAQIEEEELDKLIFKALNPETDEDEEEDIQDFIKLVEAEEVKKGRMKPKPESLVVDKPAAAVTRTYDDNLPADTEVGTGLEALGSGSPADVKPDK